MKLFGLVKPVFAQGYNASSSGTANINLRSYLKLSNGTNVSDVYSNPAVLVNVIVKNLFVVAGILMFLWILYAGFKFIQSGSAGKEEAKKTLTAAIVGFIIMFAAYWVVQILQVLTGAPMAIPAPTP